MAQTHDTDVFIEKLEDLAETLGARDMTGGQIITQMASEVMPVIDLGLTEAMGWYEDWGDAASHLLRLRPEDTNAMVQRRAIVLMALINALRVLQEDIIHGIQQDREVRWRRRIATDTLIMVGMALFDGALPLDTVPCPHCGSTHSEFVPVDA